MNYTFTIKVADTIPPAVSLIAPPNGTDLVTTNNATFNVNVTDETGLDNCTLYTNITGSWIENITVNLTGTTDSAIWSWNNLSNGTYIWNALCYDAAGNAAWNDTNYTFTVHYPLVDGTPPIVNLISPTNGTEFNTTNDATFTVNATDDYGLDNCTLYTNINGSWTANETKSFSGASSVGNWTINDIDNGTYLWNALCMDLVGNAAWNGTNFTFTVSYVPVNILPNLTANIPDQSWLRNTNNTDAFNLDDYFNDADNDTLNYTFTAVANITIVIGANNSVSFIPDTNFSGTRYVVFYANDSVNVTPSNNITLHIYFCGDGNCDSTESCSTCSIDCGSCPPTGGGGGGGGFIPRPSIIPPPVIVCSENWICADWGVCIGGAEMRTCTDMNSCGTTRYKPSTSRSCEVVCEEDWVCTDWQECISGNQTRQCWDEHSCGTTMVIPPTYRSCIVEIPMPPPPRTPLYLVLALLLILFMLLLPLCDRKKSNELHIALGQGIIVFIILLLSAFFFAEQVILRVFGMTQLQLVIVAFVIWAIGIIIWLSFYWKCRCRRKPPIKKHFHKERKVIMVKRTKLLDDHPPHIEIIRMPRNTHAHKKKRL